MVSTDGISAVGMFIILNLCVISSDSTQGGLLLKNHEIKKKEKYKPGSNKARFSMQAH